MNTGHWGGQSKGSSKFQPLMNSTHTLSTITTQVSRLGLTDTAHIKGSLVLSVVLVTDITFAILLLVPHFSKCFWWRDLGSDILDLDSLWPHYIPMSYP